MWSVQNCVLKSVNRVSALLLLLLVASSVEACVDESGPAYVASIAIYPESGTLEMRPGENAKLAVQVLDKGGAGVSDVQVFLASGEKSGLSAGEDGEVVAVVTTQNGKEFLGLTMDGLAVFTVRAASDTKPGNYTLWVGPIGLGSEELYDDDAEASKELLGEVSVTVEAVQTTDQSDVNDQSDAASEAGTPAE